MNSARLTTRLLAAGFSLFALGNIALAGVNQWTFTGPEGGSARAVAFDPTTAGVAFAGAGTAIYRTTNSGQTWTAVHENIPNGGAVGIAVDPTNANRVFAVGSNLLLRSDDAGLTFGEVNHPAGGAHIVSLAIAPDGSALYIGARNRVFRSTGNFGLQWEERSQGLPQSTPNGGGRIEFLVIDPQNRDTLYTLVNGGGLFKSVNAGVSWSPLTLPTGVYPTLIAVDPARSSDLLLAAPAGLYSSTDAGGTWTFEQSGTFMWVGYNPVSTIGTATAIRWAGPLTRRAGRGLAWTDGKDLRVLTVEDAAFDPHNPDLIDSTLLVATTSGPLHTQDNGTSFTVRASGMRGLTASSLAATTGAQGTIYAAFSSGPVGVHRRGSAGWTPVNNDALNASATYPLSFVTMAAAANPGNPDILFVASSSSVMRSLDGGASWSTPHPTFSADLAFTHSIVFDPSNPQVVYVGADSKGVYRTENLGVTWFRRANGLPPLVAHVSVDPSAEGTVYATNWDAATSLSALYKTSNAGLNWAPAGAGLNTFVQSIAVDPSDPQVVYAMGAAQDSGVYKSANGGQSWARLPVSNIGYVGDVVVDPVVPTNVFAAFNPNGSGAGRSVDGGASWEELRFASPTFAAMTKLVLDPLNPHVAVASVEGYGLVEFEVSPDLQATLQQAPASLALGGTAPAIVRVTNNGPLAASAVELTLSLPAGTTASGVTPSQGACSAQTGVSLRCALGILRTGSSIDLSMTLTAPGSPSAGNITALVSGHESDPVSANNQASAAMSAVETSELGVTLVPSAPAVDHGSAVTFTATAVNNGPNVSTAAQVVLKPGAGFTYQSASTSQGSCTHNAGTVTCALGNLAPAAQATIAIAGIASDIGALGSSAEVSGSGIDSAISNNSATATVTSRLLANAGIQLVDSADPATAGQVWQYTAAITNSGPDEVPSPSVTVNVTGATVQGATSAQGTCTFAGATVTCTLNALSNGATAIVTVNALAAAAGTATASANVAFLGTDTNSANNSASQTTTINAAPSNGGGGSGGGGGGALGLLTLAALLTAQLIRRTRRA
jgi:uncharacterized repeat protein (TIGR01451 family)